MGHSDECDLHGLNPDLCAICAPRPADTCEWGACWSTSGVAFHQGVRFQVCTQHTASADLCIPIRQAPADPAAGPSTPAAETAPNVRARRGDLVVVAWEGRAEVGLVASVTREGLAKRVQWADPLRPPIDLTTLTGSRRTLLCPKSEIDVDAALAIARARIGQGSSGAGSFTSAEEAAAALAPCRRGTGQGPQAGGTGMPAPPA